MACSSSNRINDLQNPTRWHVSRNAIVAMSYSPSNADVAEMILRYVTAHPAACDSLEGICEWWIVRQQRDDLRLAAAAALVHLVANGDLEASTGVDGHTLYRGVPAARH